MKTFEQVFEVTRNFSSHPALENAEVKGLWDTCMKVPAGGLVVEVGCQLGRSSSVIVQVGNERPYHSVHIDPFILQPDFLQAWVANMYTAAGPERHDFTLLCMKTEWAVWHLERLCRDGIDLAFIDGDHEYAGVMTDLNLLGPLIKPGGFLAMHDYGRDSLPDVWKAANEYINTETIPFPGIKWEEIGVYGTLGVWRRK